MAKTPKKNKDGFIPGQLVDWNDIQKHQREQARLRALVTVEEQAPETSQKSEDSDQGSADTSNSGKAEDDQTPET